MHSPQAFRPQHLAFRRQTSFPYPLIRKTRRAALLLATALTGSLYLTPALAFDITGAQTVDGSGGGTLGNPYTYSSQMDIGAPGNAGSITVSAGGTVTGSGLASHVYLGRVGGENGTVTITGTGSSWTSAADFSVGFSGTGSLTVSDGGSLAVRSFSIGTVSGSGTATLSGETTSVTTSGGAAVSRGSLTLSNGATLTGTGSFSIAGASSGNGVLNIGAASGNTAAAAGNLNAARVDFGLGTGTLVFNHTGTDYNFGLAIRYNGSLRFESGTTKLTGDNSDFTGSTTITGGTLQIGDGGTSGSISGDIANASALIFNRSDALSYGGVISGSGGLTKAGSGNLTLTGTNTYTGATTVSGGTLSVNGSLAGSVDILSGGTLGGSGTVGTVTTNSGATIAPGNSIGTLNVSGNADFASGTTYAVEVDDTGNADLLIATGAVTIDSGATVSVSAENGTDDGSTYAASTTYTIITAAGGVTGTFGSVTDSFAFLDAALGYGANNVTLTLTRNATGLASAANTANQRAAATGVGSLSTGNAVYDAVVVLSADSARAAFDALSGEIHSSANGLLLQESQFGRDAVGARIRAAFDGLAAGDMPMIAFHGEGEAPATAEGAVVWGQVYGGWGRTDGNGNASATEHLSGGVFFGMDTDVLDGWRAGVLAGYGLTSFSADSVGSSGDAGNYHFGAYAGRQSGALGVRLGTSLTLHDVATTRNVTVGALNNTLTADTFAATAQAFGELGYTIDTASARLEPFAGLALIHHHSGGFTETGGAAALTVSSSSQTLGVTTFGLRAEREFAFSENFTTALTGTLGWRHAFGKVDPSSTMRFAGGNAFTVAGSPIGRDTALIEAGLKFDLDEGSNVTVTYRGEIGTASQDHGLNARFSARF